MASCKISTSLEKMKEGKFLASFQESNSHMVCETCTQTSVKDLEGLSLLLKHPVIHSKNVYSFLEDNIQTFDNPTLVNSKYRDFFKL